MRNNYGFIKISYDVGKTKCEIAAMVEDGVLIENIIVAEDISVAVSKLVDGDSLSIAHFYDLGDSIQSLFGVIKQLNLHNIHLRSLDAADQWINQKYDSADFYMWVENINRLNFEIISKRTRLGLKKASDNGKILGRRPKQKENQRK